MPARVLVAVVSTLALIAVPAVASVENQAVDGRDDAVVIAVLDSSFSPYHWDFLASRMPQHLDNDTGNDLPLTQAPHEWLPGFPDPGAFASYESLKLTLEEDNPNRPTASLQAADAGVWSGMRQSTADAVHYYWAPGTKFVGAIDFRGNGLAAGNSAHGGGTTAVSAGNFHGTCPECLLVIITHGGQDREAAINWAMQQPWIDVITNSYGYSLAHRDRLYSGSDTDLQRAASERGQTVLFSAGNGQANTFTAPNTTLFSSQEGPDWIITVGAVSPSGGNYTGSGKPADIAAPGSSYPSIGGSTVSGEGTFSGTSNATPVVAGLYSRALWWARGVLGGGRIQQDGVIAVGNPVACGEARPDCELGDGVLTAAELRTRLFHGAIRTPQGPNVSIVDAPLPVAPDEVELLSEGHGTYFARLRGSEDWQAEQARITGPMDGSAPTTPRPDGELEWMVVDSHCRQSIWGEWTDGYYVAGETALPPPDPLWPLRSALTSSCEHLFPPV